MVLSGSTQKVFTNNGQFTLILEWSATQDISNNRSRVTAILKLRSAQYGQTYGWTNLSAGFNINGNNATGSINPNMSPNQTKEIWRRTVDVGHSADGSKRFSINANVNYSPISWHGGTVGNVTVSGSWDLNTIPRASSLSWTGDINHTFGKSHTFNIASASGSFRHELEFRAGGNFWSVKKDMAGGGQSFTVDPNWLSKFPSSTSVVGSMRLVTKNSGSTIGYKDYTVTLHIPTSGAYMPTITGITHSDETTNVPSVLNIAKNRGVYVQGKSSIRFNVASRGAYGSTIKSYKFEQGSTQLGTNGGYLYDVSLAKYNIPAGTQSIKVTVTDSRGRTAVSSVNVNIMTYKPPSLSFSANRLNNTDTVQIKRQVRVSSLVIDGTERNPSRLIMQYKSIQDPDWLPLVDETSTYADFEAILDVTKSFQIKATVSDIFDESFVIQNVSTAVTLFHLYKDEGVGIGKMRERGVLDVGGNTFIDGGISAKEYVSTLLNEGTDLNNVTKTGFYFCHTNNIVKTMINVPEQAAFSLLVEQHAGYKQTFTVYYSADARTYVRNYYNGVWGEWISTGGISRSQRLTPISGYSRYEDSGDNEPLATRKGDVVTLTGAFKNNSNVTFEWDPVQIGTIPNFAIPNRQMISLQQASSGNFFVLFIGQDGKISASRHRQKDSSWTQVAAGSWLNLHCTYVAKGTY